MESHIPHCIKKRHNSIPNTKIAKEMRAIFHLLISIQKL
jgi:hypothetical protein